MDLTSDSRCVGIIDLDRDGFNDFLITNSNHATLNIFHNTTGHHSPRNFVCVSVVGGNETSQPSEQYSSRDATGTIIQVETDQHSQMREVRLGEGLATQNSRIHIFGLGNSETADAISIRWASGKEVDVTGVEAGSHLTFFENPERSGNQEGYRVEPYAAENIGRYASKAASPNFNLPDAIGVPKPNSRIQIITAMATWCDSCKSHLPELEKLTSDMGSQIEIYAIAVDPDDSKQKLRDYISKYQPAYQLIEVPANIGQQFLQQIIDILGHANVPFSAIRLPDGRIHSLHPGFPSKSEIIQATLAAKESQ